LGTNIVIISEPPKKCKMQIEVVRGDRGVRGARGY
jgi:hypothetical protein